MDLDPDALLAARVLWRWWRMRRKGIRAFDPGEAVIQRAARHWNNESRPSDYQPAKAATRRPPLPMELRKRFSDMR